MHDDAWKTAAELWRLTTQTTTNGQLLEPGYRVNVNHHIKRLVLPVSGPHPATELSAAAAAAERYVTMIMIERTPGSSVLPATPCVVQIRAKSK